MNNIIKTFCLTLSILLVFLFHSFGQKKINKIDFRIGSGISNIGAGDVLVLNYENEVNYKLNNYFSLSLSVNFGKAIPSWNYFTKVLSLTQGDANIFFSPFKNFKRNDFRVGSGISILNISTAYIEKRVWVNGVLTEILYNISGPRNTIGFNMIIEDTYNFSKYFLSGFKIFINNYRSGDINAGVMLKLGIKLPCTIK